MNRDANHQRAAAESMLFIEFRPHTMVHREADRVSDLRILRNGPPGTFVVFPDGLRVSLPTDQIVYADDADGFARVGFGGMAFVEARAGRLIFRRVRDLVPEGQLSPDRSFSMMLDAEWVASIAVEGRVVWPDRSRNQA